MVRIRDGTFQFGNFAPSQRTLWVQKTGQPRNVHTCEVNKGYNQKIEGCSVWSRETHKHKQIDKRIFAYFLCKETTQAWLTEDGRDLQESDVNISKDVTFLEINLEYTKVYRKTPSRQQEQCRLKEKGSTLKTNTEILDKC